MLHTFNSKLRSRENLTEDEAAAAMEAIMTGDFEEAELVDYLVLLAEKGETVEEIAGSAKMMRQHALRIEPRVSKLVDLCGTGGDGSGTFNISTTAAFVVAGAGVAVAKHGNRSVSSKSGSSNVLEALGVKIDLEPEAVRLCIEEVGIGFLFAPNFHPAMRFAAPIRKELGRRTIFNLLGPLTNPAFTTHQVIGVWDGQLVRPYAEVLAKMGHEHALVVHGEGLDELSTAGVNQLAELKNSGEIEMSQLDPVELGLLRVELSDLAGGGPEENAEITRKILAGEKSPRRDVVLLNAAAAFVAADEVVDFATGIEKAAHSIDSGAALSKLDQMIEFTNVVGVR